MNNCLLFLKRFIPVIILSFGFLFIFTFGYAQHATIKNFNKDGEQVTRFDKLGDAFDAHDGEIAYFNCVYYLYGTSYGCGFEWGHKDAPFCGFKTYSSTDMVNWTDKGQLGAQKAASMMNWASFTTQIIFIKFPIGKY